MGNIIKTCSFRLIFLLVIIIDVSGSVKIFKMKYFVAFLPWWRIEAYSNCAVDDIPENFSAMKLGVEVNKLHD